MTFHATNTPSPPTRRTAWRRLAVVAAAAMLAAACSSTSDNADDSDPAVTPPATTAHETTVPAATTAAQIAEAPTATAAPLGTTPAVTAPDARSDDDTTSPADITSDENTTPDGDTGPQDTTPAGDTAAGDTPDGDTVNDTGPAETGDTTDTTEPADPAAGRPEPEIRRTPGALLKDSWYYDHAAIAALFPECPPDSLAADDWRWRVFDYWDETYAGWDLEARVPVAGDPPIAAGWWTAEQLERAYPGYGLTAESARADVRYSAALDAVYLWQGHGGSLSVLADLNVSYAPLDLGDDIYAFENLYHRVAAVGYTNPDTDNDLYPYIRDDGASGGNLPDTNVADLMWEWTMTRYQYPPTVHEPAAWAMRTLLTARESECVAEQMQAVCDSGEGDGLLARDDRFGRVLWSLVCPDA